MDRVREERKRGPAVEMGSRRPMPPERAGRRAMWRAGDGKGRGQSARWERTVSVAVSTAAVKGLEWVKRGDKRQGDGGGELVASQSVTETR